MKKKGNDDWQTPDWLYGQLNKEFNFILDVCASPTNNKCLLYYCKDNSCLNKEWDFYRGSTSGIDYSCFMNPPYSDPAPFIQKAWEQSKKGRVVCILKGDTSTKWWGIFWDHEKHKPRHGCKQIRFMPRRVKFVPPPGSVGANGPTFPTAIVIMDRRKKLKIQQRQQTTIKSG